MNDIASAGSKRTSFIIAIAVMVLCSITVQPISNTTNASGSSSSTFEISIPYAKVGLSSYFAPFRSFEDIFDEESLKAPGFPWPTHFSRELVTNEHGNAFVKTMFGRVAISSDANGFLQKSTEFPLRVGEAGNVTLRMERTGAIVGRVLDESGNPLAGAVIDVSGLPTSNVQGTSECEFYAGDISAHDGTYVMTSGINPRCEYRIEAYMPPYAYYSRWYLDPFHGQQLTDEFSSNDLNNITVLAFKDPYDFDKRYQSSLFNSTTLQRVKVLEDKATEVDIIINSMDAGKERSGLISGKVIDTAGKPMPYAVVRASTQDESSISESATDMNGIFTIRHVRAGNYTIDFQLQDHRLVAKHLTDVLVDESQNVDVGEIIAESSASIGGRVVLSDGTPVTDVFVDIRPVRLDAGYEHYYPCEDCIATHISDELDQRGTDKQGRYFLAKNLPPGTYNITINNYELRLDDRRVKLEPKTITVVVDDGHGKQIANADLVFNYTVIQNYASSNATSIRFFGSVKDDSGNPLGNVGISARPDIQNYGGTDFQALTDENGFYSLYIRQQEMPENDTSVSRWTLYVHPNPDYDQYIINYEDVMNKSFAIYNYEDGQGYQNVVADWGEEKRHDFTLRKFTSDDVLRSSLDVNVIGEDAKYSLPLKQFTLTTGYDNNGNSEDVLITTNSTLIGAWIDGSRNVLQVELDPVAGTTGTMEIVIPKRLATGVKGPLFDGTEEDEGSPNTRSAEITENATHTMVSLTYRQDFKSIALQATTVIPEFGAGMVPIIMAISITSMIAIIMQRRLLLRKQT